MPSLFRRTDETYAFLMSQDASNNKSNTSVPNIATGALEISHGVPMTAIIIVLVEIILISAFTLALAKWCLNQPVPARQPEHEVKTMTRIPLQELDAPTLDIMLPEPNQTHEDKKNDSDTSPARRGLECNANKAREGSLCGLSSSRGLLISHLMFKGDERRCT